MNSNLKIAVVGAGAFGGWTALHLLERGARVLLLDAWGPGNSRASSGGETRIMRGTYGPAQPYTRLAARALKLWQEYEQRWKKRFLHRNGVLWMVSSNEDAYERGSLEVLRKNGIKFRQFSTAEMSKRWPQINFSDVRWGLFEPECGYLDARRSCQAVVDAFCAQGGEYRPLGALAEGLEDAPRSLLLSDGSRLKADRYVFASGPWLGKLFPETMGKVIRPTKQDIFFFGPPLGEARFTNAHLPVWGDHLSGDHDGRFFYGIPGSGRRGFKIADDTRGAPFDPTDGERVVSSSTLKRVREYMSYRFPAMKDAPLIETRVCQYEQTADSDFVVDRHPRAENVWILGGGSGHGFKHGPALGEMMANVILENGSPDPAWRLARFAMKTAPARKSEKSR